MVFCISAYALPLQFDLYRERADPVLQHVNNARQCIIAGSLASNSYHSSSHHNSYLCNYKDVNDDIADASA
jgi:single-stranded DNA-binding protein